MWMEKVGPSGGPPRGPPVPSAELSSLAREVAQSSNQPSELHKLHGTFRSNPSNRPSEQSLVNGNNVPEKALCVIWKDAIPISEGWGSITVPEPRDGRCGMQTPG